MDIARIQGLGVLLGVGREPRPRPNCGWLAVFLCVKSKGVERGDFVTDLSWSTNHVATKKDLENCSTAVLDKDEHLS